MVRSLLNVIMMLAFVLPAGTAVAGSRAKAATKQPVQEQAPNVNYDDPNMAFSPDYAADSAITCPKTLKGRRLRECLLKNGLAVSEDMSDGSEILTNASSTSYH